MVSQLENELCYIKKFSGVYEENCIVNSVPVNDWTAECAIITSNDSRLKAPVDTLEFFLNEAELSLNSVN